MLWHKNTSWALADFEVCHMIVPLKPNLAAMRTLAAIYIEAEQLPCVGHTLDHVGEHFHIPNLTPILHAWVGSFVILPKQQVLGNDSHFPPSIIQCNKMVVRV